MVQDDLMVPCYTGETQRGGVHLPYSTKPHRYDHEYSGLEFTSPCSLVSPRPTFWIKLLVSIGSKMMRNSK